MVINYKHLHYFWMVAKSGSVTRAAEQLHVTPQTISGQLTQFEGQFSEALFKRSGRRLELTETGLSLLGYAEQIFTLGRELEEAMQSQPKDKPLIFNVGIVDVVPKSIAHRLLAPAMNLPEPIRIICKEGPVDSLLAEIALHKLDIVIADCTIPASVSIKGYNHFLGDSGITFFAAKNLAAAITGPFPECLNGLPFLVPGKTAVIRNMILNWLEKRKVKPVIIGEIEDSALLKAFGGGGAGVFAMPTAIEDEVEAQYGVVSLGRTTDVRDHYYAIAVERHISHPAVVAVTENARKWLAPSGAFMEKEE